MLIIILQYLHICSYHRRCVDDAVATPAFPREFEFLVQRALEAGLVTADTRPDQAIINEYLAKEGIRPHVDSIYEWGSVVLSLSLLAQYPMQFIPLTMGQVRTNLAHLRQMGKAFTSDEESVIRGWSQQRELAAPLARRSLLVLHGVSRYLWKHGIAAREADDGVPRTRRVSVTLRRRHATIVEE